jgi:hypothetical protein
MFVKMIQYGTDNWEKLTIALPSGKCLLQLKTTETLRMSRKARGNDQHTLKGKYNVVS